MSKQKQIKVKKIDASVIPSSLKDEDKPITHSKITMDIKEIKDEKKDEKIIKSILKPTLEPIQMNDVKEGNIFKGNVKEKVVKKDIDVEKPKKKKTIAKPIDDDKSKVVKPIVSSHKESEKKIFETTVYENDYREIIMNYNPEKNKSIPILTDYEITFILGKRATQIAYGAIPLIDVKSGMNHIQIAEEELKQKKTPYIIKRTIGNKVEYYKICDMIGY